MRGEGKFLVGQIWSDDTIHFRTSMYGEAYYSPITVPKDKFIVLFDLSSEARERQAFKTVAEVLASEKIEWLRPVSGPSGRWFIDFDRLKLTLSDASPIAGCSGKQVVHPQFAMYQTNEDDDDLVKMYHSVVWFESPDEPAMEYEPVFFPELQSHIDKFQMDHSDAMKTAFVMMRFADTDLQTKAFQTVVETCMQFGITALRADGKTYADELFPNIRTYMHGCGFGIAIFERITSDDFNPNVSLEVGYMMALGKPVCLLKDQTLRSLHTDLVGRLYESFNPQSPEASLPARLTKWMRDKGIIPFAG